ncbi:MAG: hypothetical protein JSW59_12965 [Phycisphaerales bacterium]|nr:MAG: hypothetical protein JSW59_12965 [Phycisphaerales bacterium]
MSKKPNSYLLWGWYIGVFFMTALSIAKYDLYERIGCNEISLSEFTAFLKDYAFFTKVEGDGFVWAEVLYLGAFGNQPLGTLEKEFQELGVWDSWNKEEDTFQNQLQRFGKSFSSWGDLPKRGFSRIYDILEGLKTFAEK